MQSMNLLGTGPKQGFLPVRHILEKNFTKREIKVLYFKGNLL